VKAADFPALSSNRKRPLDLRNVFSCPEPSAPVITRRCGSCITCSWAAYDMNTIVDAIDKIVEQQKGLRELDHKAIRNLRLSWAIREG
jgi:hypothetical protein